MVNHDDINKTNKENNNEELAKRIKTEEISLIDGSDDIGDDDSQITSKKNAFQKSLARIDYKKITCLRMFVSFVLIVTTSAMAYTIYDITRRGENEQFETQFYAHANKIIDSIQEKLKQKIGAIDNAGVSITSQAQTTNSVWPFFVMPQFEIRGASTKSISGSDLVAFVPLVTNETRTEWELFSINQSYWINDGLEHESHVFIEKEHLHDHRRILQQQQQQQQQRYDDDDIQKHRHLKIHVPINLTDGISDQIYRLDEEAEEGEHVAIIEDSIGPYFPIWQATPVQAELVNYNLLSHETFGRPLEISYKSEAIVFSSFADISDVHDPFHFLYHAVDGHDAGEHDDNGSHDEEEHSDDSHDSHDDHDDDEEEEDEHDDHDDHGHRRLQFLSSSARRIEEEEHDDHDHDESVDHLEDEVDEDFHHKGDNFGDPISLTYFPVFDDFEEPRQLVGVIMAVYYWVDFFLDILPPETKPIYAILRNGCGQKVSFLIIGDSAKILGSKDYHETKFDDWEVVFDFRSFSESDRAGTLTYSGVGLNMDYCRYELSLYPSTEFQDFYLTTEPIIYTAMVVATLLFTAFVFCVYDTLVQKRQKSLVKKADQTTAVVNSLFPDVVRDRLLRHNDEEPAAASKITFLARVSPENRGMEDDAPIADLFPNATVLFADIAGFTAWSSVREPCQVFTLLEAVFGAFDSIARKYRVFKIETIGDSYLAVTGLPKPQPNHAMIMAKFAGQCLLIMDQLTGELQVSLGPDTADLKIRIGMHSGPVTAGVLRGEKSRFQLFGDTVNMASRMESNGKANQIQCSQSTADLITNAGRGEWVVKREDRIHAKGKGELQTYWLMVGTTSSSPFDGSSNGEQALGGVANHIEDEAMNNSASVVTGSGTFKSNNSFSSTSFSAGGRLVGKERQDRLVNWYVDMLKNLLREIVARRKKDKNGIDIDSFTLNGTVENPIEEVVDAIPMSRVEAFGKKSKTNLTSISLDTTVTSELKDYIDMIAQMYNDNPFHNFEHSIHVSMSALKLLKRISSTNHAPDRRQSERTLASNLHKSTYGLSSDVLAHFAIVFSTMIHDVDHSGVPNSLIEKENPTLASTYKNKSIAEQNSVDVAWDLFMEPSYSTLRKCLFQTENEFRRFRNIVINSVMATDLFSKELTDSRNKRWQKVFNSKGESGHQDEEKEENIDLKATLAMEHLIQASDVSHTMQHWHVYQKWNEKLFKEAYLAYKTGRSDKDPAEDWYNGELWFYDEYIIPLANKLTAFGIFGVSSNEYLNYAVENRREWETKGRSSVQDWVSKYDQEFIPFSPEHHDLSNSSTTHHDHSTGDKSCPCDKSWSQLMNLSATDELDIRKSKTEKVTTLDCETNDSNNGSNSISRLSDSFQGIQLATIEEDLDGDKVTPDCKSNENDGTSTNCQPSDDSIQGKQQLSTVEEDMETNENATSKHESDRNDKTFLNDQPSDDGVKATELSTIDDDLETTKAVGDSESDENNGTSTNCQPSDDDVQGMNVSTIDKDSEIDKTTTDTASDGTATIGA